MNSLVIPPSPNWYETSILACALDNTLVYGARNDIVIIHNSQKDQPADVKIIPRAHSQKITSVNLNKNWGQPNKLLVTVSDDKVVKLWNVDTLEKKNSHSLHKSHNKVIGATFAGDERIISVSEEGAIVVWNLGLNQPNLLKDIFGFKVSVTCISTCPHANWLTAFGLKNGLVVITDLRKQGKVLYKLRGHDKAVLSLAWCPAPINIFPKDPHNYVGLKKNTQISGDCPIQQASEDISNAIDNKSPDKENIADESKVVKNVTKIDKKNIWSNLKHADDDELPKDYREQERTHPLLRVYDSGDDDFLKECQKLKNQILGSDTSNTSNDTSKSQDRKKDRPILKAKKHVKAKSPRSSELEDEPKEESMETEVFFEKCEDFGNEEKDNSVGECIEENVTVDEKLEEDEIEIDKELVNDVKKVDVDQKEVSEEKELETTGDKIDLIDSSNEVSSSEVKREIPKNVPVEEEPRKEFLLASSAKEGHIYIWRAGTDGRMQTFLTVPNKGNNRRSSKTHPDKVWITLCWISPTMLLSSSKSGELFHWTLPKPKDKSKQYRLVHNDHSSLLFSIAAPITLLNENNWLDVDEKKLNTWTIGQDRLLLNTSLSSERMNLCCYPTVGVVECFASSPVDASRLAIGTAEGLIKIWDLSRPHTRNIVMTNFYQKIQSKVVTLAWHPKQEVKLAYGTLEGRIGLLDISNKSKTPTLLPHFFKSQIHKIEWGPLSGDKEQLGLFAVAEGKLVAYNTKKSEKEPQEVDTPDNTFVYTFSWKPDYETMLVSSKAGALIIYSSDLKIISTHYLQRKLQTILWHPTASQNDRTTSKYCQWFASVSNSKEIFIYDLGIESDNNEQKIVAKYVAGDMINSIAWNPFEESQLVIASDDGIAQIWDALGGTVLWTYVNPNFESILAVTWSPVDADHVISAGKDHTIRIWKVSDYPVKNDEEISDMRKKCVKETPDDPSEVAPKLEKSQDEPTKAKKTNKNNLLPNFYNPKNTAQIVADLRRLLLWKEDSNGCVEPQIGDCEPNILNVFGSNVDMLKIIRENETSHKTRGKYNLNNTLSLFKGDVGTAVKEAIEEKRVSPWVIMMAPMVSPKLWKTACEVYAQQLSEESDADPLEIATYYLACHKVEEAIDVLCEGGLFREALALAKCRLPENDPAVTRVVEKWASYSLIVGNFETAAQCNIYLGKYEEAASVLFRRSDMEILKFAMELAEKSGNEELYKAVLFRYNAFKPENDVAIEDKELSSKVEVMLLQNGSEKTDEKKICGVRVEGEIETGKCEKMATSLNEGRSCNGEAPQGRQLRRSSSLEDNFRVNVTNDEEVGLENGSNGLLMTGDVKKLLGDLRVVGECEGGSLDPGEGDPENCQ